MELFYNCLQVMFLLVVLFTVFSSSRTCTNRCLNVTNTEMLILQIHLHTCTSGNFNLTTKARTHQLNSSQVLHQIFVAGIQSVDCAAQSQYASALEKHSHCQTKDSEDIMEGGGDEYRSRWLVVENTKGLYFIKIGERKLTRIRMTLSNLVPDTRHNLVYGIMVCIVFSLRPHSQKHTSVYSHCPDRIVYMERDSITGELFIMDRKYAIYRLKNKRRPKPTRIPISTVVRTMVVDEINKLLYIVDRHASYDNIVALSYDGKVKNTYRAGGCHDLTAVDNCGTEIVYKYESNFFSFNTLTNQSSPLPVKSSGQVFHVCAKIFIAIDEARVKIYNRKWDVLTELPPPRPRATSRSLALL